jgi:hypothetical protein
MLITEKELRRLIQKQLLKEVSDEKFKELGTYVKKLDDDYQKKGLRHGVIIKNVMSPKVQQDNDLKYFNINKPIEDYQEKTTYTQFYPMPDEIWDPRKMNARYHKKWWQSQHDKDLFNNPKDLANRREKIIAIHDLNAYAPQNLNNLDEFCNFYDRIYPDIFNKKQKNELSAFGYINQQGLDAYEICKGLIGKTVSAGALNMFFYLNPRVVTYASKFDVCTEKFSDYKKNYYDQTKNSGTRKYPMHFKSDIKSNFENDRNVLDHFTVLDAGDFPTDNKKILHEMTVGNWQPDSLWINIDFNDFYNALNLARQENKDITIKEYIETKSNFKEYQLLYFFCLKGIKCFDCNGQKLNKEIYIRINNDL